MLTKIYKLIFDISVCYTLGAFLLQYVGGIRIHGRGYVILLFASLMSLLFKKKPWTMTALVIIPAVSLIFHIPSIPELMLYIFVGMYVIYVTLLGRYDINRGEFLDRLKRFVYILLFMTFLILTNAHNYVKSFQEAGPYLIITLISSVFLLRHLRAINQMEQMKQYRRQQFIEVLAFLIICLLLTLTKTPQNLMYGFKLLYLNLLAPILTLVTSIISLVIGVMTYLILGLIELVTNHKGLQEVKISDTIEQSMDAIRANNTSIVWLRPLLYSAGILFGLIIIFFFLRWLIGEKLRQKPPVGVLEIREDIEETGRDKISFLMNRPKETRMAVRYYYRKCMLWIQHKKVELHPQDTTKDIHQKFNGILIDKQMAASECSKQLMKLYRKARYRMEEQITKEEVETAKKLYQAIKRSNNG